MKWMKMKAIMNQQKSSNKSIIMFVFLNIILILTFIFRVNLPKNTKKRDGNFGEKLVIKIHKNILKDIQHKFVKKY
jgi:hypothetical protein